MSRREWLLLDVANDVYLHELTIRPGDVSKEMGDFTVQKRVLRGGLRDGVNVVEIDNGRCALTILPDRGMGVWRGRVGDVDLSWPSPVRGPVHPKFVSIFEPNGIGWLQGFDELLVRCGLENNGAPEWDADGKLVHSLHGRIANLPAHTLKVEIDPETETIAVTGVVDEARLFGQKLRLASTVTTRLGQPGFSVRDAIVNFGAQPADLELLYHINLGPPFITPGAQFNAAVRTLAPKDVHTAKFIDAWQTYGEPEVGAQEHVFFFELLADDDGRARTLLKNAAGDRALGVRFPVAQFPYFTLWKSPLPGADAYVTGLEPCINFPHGKSFEKSKGRVALLTPGEERVFDIELSVYGDAKSIEVAEQSIAKLQTGAQPKIESKPRADWSPE